MKKYKWNKIKWNYEIISKYIGILICHIEPL